MRQLATIRRITNIQPIKDRDLIVCANVDGWTVVVAKDQFKIGDPCVYFEPDSFLPTGDPRWQMLVDKKSKEYEGQVGHVLKTIRMGGVYSNGFCVKLSDFPELQHVAVDAPELNIDVTSILGIKKYDPPEVLGKGGATKGNFPSFIPKSDEPRCQNLNRTIFDREIHVATYTDSSGNTVEVRNYPKNTDDTEYEVTVKMDGSSFTSYHYNGTVGVCSRNLELKIDEPGNTFVDMFNLMKFEQVLPQLGNFAFQLELCGPKIQNNQENFNKFHLFLFKIYDINERRYLQPDERREMYAKLRELVGKANSENPEVLEQLHHVPILYERVKLKDLNIHSVADLLNFATGPSFNTNVQREGVTFKRYDPDVNDTFSFKAISESWLSSRK